MSFDYKKEYKEFYRPKSKPSIVEIPKMHYIAIKGKGDTNQEEESKKEVVNDSPIDGYLNQLSDDRRDVINKLREIIKSKLPDEYEEKIQYDMISYVVPREKFPQGYHCNPEDDLCFISLGSQKNHIAIYHMGLYFFEDVHKWFLSEYPNYMKTKPDVGKSCIRFKNMKTVPYELIGKLCEKISMREFIDKYKENLSSNKK